MTKCIVINVDLTELELSWCLCAVYPIVDRKKERKRRTNVIHLYAYIHTYIHTYINECTHTTTCIHCGYLLFFLCDCCRLCKSMLIVCMYGCVSDRMGPRLFTWLLRMGIFGRWRSSWTIPRTRRPSPRYEEAVTATYRWNHLRPKLPYSVLHSYIRTYIHTYMIIPDVWQYLGEEMPSFLSHNHTYKYVCRLLHTCTCIQCMYVWMCVQIMYMLMCI